VQRRRGCKGKNNGKGRGNGNNEGNRRSFDCVAHKSAVSYFAEDDTVFGGRGGGKATANANAGVLRCAQNDTGEVVGLASG